MKHYTAVIMSDVVRIAGCDYFVANINTKGDREIIDLDIVRPTEGRALKIVKEYTEASGNDPQSPVFFDAKTNKWRHKNA